MFIFLYLDTASSRPSEHEAGGCEERTKGTFTRYPRKYIFLYLNTAGSRPGEHEAGGCQGRTKVTPTYAAFALIYVFLYLDTADSSVVDPDPHVFGPPGSGSTSQRYGSGSVSGSFYHHAKIVRKTFSFSLASWRFPVDIWNKTLEFFCLHAFSCLGSEMPGGDSWGSRHLGGENV